MKLRTLAVILALVAGGGWLAYAQWQNGALAVAAATPARGPLTEYVEERAITRLPQVHRVTMPQAALVRPQALEVGQQVAVGELLAQLDQRPLELAVGEAEAMLEEQDAVLAKSRDNSLETKIQQQSERLVESVSAAVESAVERVQAGEERADFAKRIRDRLRGVAQATSKNELEQAELQAVEAVSSSKQDKLVVSASRAIEAATVLLPKMVTDYIQRKTLDDAVTQARRRAVNSQLEQARLREREGSLRSPVDGIVLEAPVDAPQHLGFGELVCVVGQLSELEIETDILSEDAVRITRGDACAITGPALAAAPEGALQGIVERVSPNAFMKVSSLGVEQQRVKVVVRLDDDQIAAARQANLGVGYQVDVRIITDERDDVLQIPRSALFRDRDGRWQVFVIARGKAERRAVSIGIQSDTHAEVLSGLEPSDIVITEPESRITEGARVRPF